MYIITAKAEIRNTHSRFRTILKTQFTDDESMLSSINKNMLML